MNYWRLIFRLLIICIIQRAKVLQIIKFVCKLSYSLWIKLLKLLIEIILIFMLALRILELIIFKMALSYAFSYAGSYTIFLVYWKYLKLGILNHGFSHSLCAIVIFFWILKRWGFYLVFRLTWLFRLFYLFLIWFKFHVHFVQFIDRLKFFFNFNLAFFYLAFSGFFYFLKLFYNFLLYWNYFIFRFRFIFRIQTHNFIVSLLILLCLNNLKFACFQSRYSWAAMIQI